MSDIRPPFHRQIFDLIQAAVLALFLMFCRILPIDWASGLGGYIGRTIGPRMGQNRKAIRNLSRAFPNNSPEDNRRIIRGMWDNLGRVIAEYPHLPRICAKLHGGRLEVIGEEIIRNMATDGRPGMLFGAHLANWEVTAYASRLTGLRLPLVYRAPNNPWSDKLLRYFRDSPMLIPKGAEGARALLRLIRDGGHACMLVDQKMNDGIAVPFFGRAAMTAPAIAQFALRFNCVLVAVRAERLTGARFRITIHPPLKIDVTGDRATDEFRIMTKVNTVIEDWVRKRPEQWLWLHRRWPD